MYDAQPKRHRRPSWSLQSLRELQSSRHVDHVKKVLQGSLVPRAREGGQDQEEHLQVHHRLARLRQSHLGQRFVDGCW